MASFNYTLPEQRRGDSVPHSDNPDAPGDSSRPRGEMELEYDMNHVNRGKAVIIGNQKFKSSTRLAELEGTDKDIEALNSCFGKLGFSVESHSDLTSAEMQEVLKNAALDDHSDSDCFMCAITSHGNEGIVCGTDGPTDIKTLLAPFKGDQCRSLAGKPKIFFIDACRGDLSDGGVEVLGYGGTQTHSGETQIQIIPTEADFLIAYAPVPGTKAWINSANGGCFIQAISKVFKEHGTKDDLLTLMTMVNYKVACDFEAYVTQGNGSRKRVKQMPCITSTLTKKILF